MKKFIKKAIIISLPIILIGISIELIIAYYPNTFNTKANYLHTNLNNIECIFLGSSHTQNSINPKFLNMTSANLAYGSQDYQLDSAIFFNYVKKLKNLKKVIVEIDYHSLEKKNSDDYFRLSWYYKYYDINLGDFRALDKMSLFYSNKSFFKNYLINKLNPFQKRLIINEFGFVENDSDIFEKLKFNKAEILQTSEERLKNSQSSLLETHFKFNKKKIESIIHYCNENNIQVIVLKNPVYITYRNNYIWERNKRRSSFLEDLISKGKIKIIDFESDERFNVKDFKDDDHLNSKGAEKLANFVNEELSN